MIILGIDPGYDRLGIAVIKKEKSAETLVFSTCLLTDKKTVFGERLVKLGTELEKIIKKYRPDETAIEGLYFSVNQKTAIKVAEVRGMITYLCAKAGLPIFEYNPMQIKTCATGYGGADKKQVIELIKRQIKIIKPIKLDDEFDAIAVALTHSAMRKFSLSA